MIIMITEAIRRVRGGRFRNVVQKRGDAWNKVICN